MSRSDTKLKSFNRIHKSKPILFINTSVITKISILKLLNIKIHLVVNIECIVLAELVYHDIFDNILTNNNESHIILSHIFNKKEKHLGFTLNHHYFKNVIKKPKNKNDIIKFFCIGGLNSLSRKNIDIIIQSFYNIFNEKKYMNWELTIYIEGVEIPPILNKYKCINIKYYIEHFSYKHIIDKYIENDICIHLGTHEGLGLGFYESIHCGTPMVTLNWYPNNEIIQNYNNGWLLNCNFTNLNDGNCTIINKGVVSEYILRKKIIEILSDKYNTFQIIKSTYNNRENIIMKHKTMFESNLLDIL